MPKKKLSALGEARGVVRDLTRRVRGLTPRQIAAGAVAAALVIVFVAVFVVPPSTALTVNGIKVSKRRFRALLRDHVQKAELEFARRGQTLDLKSPQGKQTIAAIEGALIDQQVNNILLFQEAKARGIDATEDRVQAQLNLLRAQSGDEKFSAALKEKGLSMDDLREDMRTQLSAEAALNDLIRDVVVKEGEVRAFYEKNRGRYTRPETVRIRHIQTVTPQDAAACLKEISKGEAFAEAARKWSVDIVSSDQGGLWEYRSREEMPPAVAAAAFSLRPGEKSGVIPAPDGFHIIEVVDVKPGGPETFPEAREQVINDLLEIGHKTAVAGVLDELRKKAVIEVNL